MREMLSQLLRGERTASTGLVASSAVAAISAILYLIYKRRKPAIDIPLNDQSLELQVDLVFNTVPNRPCFLLCQTSSLGEVLFYEFLIILS